MLTKRIGSQEPTIHFALPHQETEGPDAVALYELTGRTALKWQRRLIDDILARNEDGLWTHTRYGYSVPRQNGKGEILAIREIYGLAMGERILHTAHLTSTSHKAWERLGMLLDTLGITYSSIKAKGQELIEITGGGRVEFRTRTPKGALGESYDLLVIDEAQEYQSDQKTALQYVISASDNPQTILCGTPPTPVSSGTIFKTFRSDVLTGAEEEAGWAEWSVEDFADVNDRELWYMTNPSLGVRITERTIAAERGTDEASRLDFNIQRLGLWIRYNQQSAITKNDWSNILLAKLPKLTGKMNIGIKFAKDGETVSMAVAVKTRSGKIFFEVIGSRPMRNGIEWIVEFLKASKSSVNRIVIDGQNGQQILDDALKAEKIKNTVLPKVSQVVKAYAAFEQDLFDEKLCRMEQPSLTAVATNCEKRRIGSGGGFGYSAQKDGADISLLDAVVYAVWAVEEFPESRTQRVRY